MVPGHERELNPNLKVGVNEKFELSPSFGSGWVESLDKEEPGESLA